MSQIAVLLPNGYEEMEAIAVVDLLRRAGETVDLISITGSLETQGDHGIRIQADALIEAVKPSDYDMLVTPGGLPGTRQLQRHAQTRDWLLHFAEQNKWIAMICASPMVLKSAGLSQNYTGVCYPGCEDQVGYAADRTELVFQDRNLITSRGPATALPFALKLVEVLQGTQAKTSLEQDLLWDRVKAHPEQL